MASPPLLPGRSTFARGLASAPAPAAACQAVVDHVGAAEGLLPSVYLERGGRLRCQAIRGYWQTRDGFPPSAGVIGRTFRTGVTAVEVVGASVDYLEAATGIAAELCVAVRCAGRVVGVVNVESRSPLADGLAAEVEAVAAMLGERLEELGGALVPSAAQRLFAHVARLSAMTSIDEIEVEVLEAARSVTGMDSALLVRLDDAGAPFPTRAAGPLAAALQSAPSATLAAIESFVAAGTSCYTVGEPGGGIPAPMETLRRAGAEAIAAVRLARNDVPCGFLVTADTRDLVPDTDDVELLEVLAAQAATCLHTAGLVGELRRRAARDPLTGLGHHATFHETLGKRRAAAPCAVLLIDVDGFKTINDTRGHQAGDRVLREVASTLSGALRHGDELFRVGGDEFAAIVAVADGPEAADAGGRLRAAAAELGSLTVSIGAAVPRPGESDASLLARADAALYAVKGAGRDAVALAG